MTDSNTNPVVDMEAVAGEIASLSPDTRQFLNDFLSTQMIAEDGTIVNRPPRAGARKTVVRPTQADVAVMDFLISSGLPLGASTIRSATNLEKREVSAALTYLTSCSFLHATGNGPSRTYQAATQNPVYPEHKQASSRRSGPHIGPTARAAFITALNEVGPGDEFTLVGIRSRAIELFPESSFKDSSFGAIPARLVDEKHIFATGNGRKRVFTMGSTIIPGGAAIPAQTPVSSDEDTVQTLVDDGTDQAVVND